MATGCLPVCWRTSDVVEVRKPRHLRRVGGLGGDARIKLHGLIRIELAEGIDPLADVEEAPADWAVCRMPVTRELDGGPGGAMKWS